MADERPLPKRGPRGDPSNIVRAGLVSLRFFPPGGRLNRLRTMVEQLAAAIERGDVTPEPGELEVLAEILHCEGLSAESKRVLRWIGK